MAQPTDRDQEMLELVNRMRQNPAAELDLLLNSSDPKVGRALDFFKVDRNLLRQQWQQLQPVAPVAWSSELDQAATVHNQLMIANDQQSHNLPGEPDLIQRVVNDGYSNGNRFAENVYTFSDSVVFGHASFALDWGNGPGGIQTPAEHRESMMSTNYRELGIAIEDESNPATRVGPTVVTQEFADRTSLDGKAWLLGVAYDDRNNNSFYTAGEGAKDITVRVAKADGSAPIEVKTADAGGYQVLLDPGSYQVQFLRSGQVLNSQTFAIDPNNPANVKRDLVLNAVTPPATPAVPPVTQNPAPTPVVTPEPTPTPIVAENPPAPPTPVVTPEPTPTPVVVENPPIPPTPVVTPEPTPIPVVVENPPALPAPVVTPEPTSIPVVAENPPVPPTPVVTPEPTPIPVVAGNLPAPLTPVVTPEPTIAPAAPSRLRGTPNADNLVGQSGNDSIIGLDSNDSVSGAGGDDRLFGNEGNDQLSGGLGDDEIVGGRGDDTLTGGTGNDQLCGGSGNDRLWGEAGDDILLGGSGDDQLVGSAGNDTLIGSSGNDRFIFESAGAFQANDFGLDLIRDFKSGEDKIQLGGESFPALQSIFGNGFSQANEFATVADDGAVAASAAEIVYSSGSGQLFYNANGAAAGLGDGAAIALFSNQPALTANDFVIAPRT
jgi:RTX calcium-binding nonapeptide repeat (4 copies)/Cysteine-rich secretory protein family